MNKHRLRGTGEILMGLALLLLVLGLSSAQSVTAAKAKGAVSWTGSVSSDWNHPFNWDAFQVPGSSNAVTIGATFNAPVISSDVVIASLTFQGGELTLNNNSTLTINQNVHINTETILNGNGTLRVEGTLNLTSGRLFLGSSNLTLGEGASVTGGSSASTMVVADSSGEMRKRFASPSEFTFPVGTGTTDYSPMTINVTVGNFTGSPYVGVRVTDGVHPTINVSHYLSRFWTTSSNFSTVTADVTLNYLDNDVVGDENIYKLQLFNNGSWQQASSTTVNAGANQITGTGFNSLSGDFSAGVFPLPVQLDFFDATSANKYVLLSWATTMELNNLGFNLYRGIEGSRAPIIKINDQLIPAQAPGSGSGAYYEYRDHSVRKGLRRPGRPYLYWLEDVDTNGVKTWYGPVSVTVQSKWSIEKVQPVQPPGIYPPIR